MRAIVERASARANAATLALVSSFAWKAHHGQIPSSPQETCPLPEQEGDPQGGEPAPLSITAAFWLVTLACLVPWAFGFYGGIHWLIHHLRLP